MPHFIEKTHASSGSQAFFGLVNFYCVTLTVFRGKERSNQRLGANKKQVLFRNMFIFSFHILIYWILWSWAHTEMWEVITKSFLSGFGFIMQKKKLSLSSHLVHLRAFSSQQCVLPASLPYLVICYPNMIYVRVLELSPHLIYSCEGRGGRYVTICLIIRKHFTSPS